MADSSGKKTASYGEWVTPISSQVATAKAVVLREVRVDNTDSSGTSIPVNFFSFTGSFIL